MTKYNHFHLDERYLPFKIVLSWTIIHPYPRYFRTIIKKATGDEIDIIGNNRLMENNMEDRWSLPDLTSAMQWCGGRTRQHIRCTLAVIAEFARTPEEAQQALMLHLAGIRMAGEESTDISFSIKPSAIGMLFDHGEYVRNVSLLFHEARDWGVPFEIDMEGRPLVGDTLRSALDLASEGGPVTLALQAYLDRTSRDLTVCMNAGITVRLVKGAYLGDTDNFTTIQKQFRTHAENLISSGNSFSAATHDPVLIDWLREEMRDHKNLIEFNRPAQRRRARRSQSQRHPGQGQHCFPFGRLLAPR